MSAGPSTSRGIGQQLGLGDQPRPAVLGDRGKRHRASVVGASLTGVMSRVALAATGAAMPSVTA